MNKELQDLAWSVLPKEFKEEVKKEWQTANDEERFPHDAFLRGCYSTMVLLFSYHNLTSDAEEEEMLTVRRKKVQEEYAVISKELSHRDTDAEDYIAWNYAKMTFENLFGSKCLPDEEPQKISSADDCIAMAKEEMGIKEEPKPAEPKFKVGDKVKDISSPHDGGIYKVDDIKKSSDGFIYHIQGLIGKSNVKESALEPYTEPTENRNLSQNIADCDKHFDNILREGFSKERRLNIAAMTMAALLASGKERHPVKRALELTDALVAACTPPIN